MALLQDEEARRRKILERQARRNVQAVRFTNIGLILGVLVVAGLLLVAVLVLLPGRTPRTVAPTNQSDELAHIRELLDARAAAVIPEAIENVRAGLNQGDFGLLANPSAISASPGSEATFDVYVVRSDNFSGEVALIVSGAPAGVTASINPDLVSRDGVAATLTLALGDDVATDTYTLTISGSAPNRAHDTTVTLTVSRMVATNIRSNDIRAMDQGTRWQATIAWETDTAANTWVEYATQDFFANENLTYEFTATEETNATNHSITLTNLDPETIYHYRVKSVDERNNVLVSTDQYFYTVPPVE